MSKYDEERNKILERMQKSNVSFAPDAAPSKYKADRSASSVTSKYDYDRMNNDPIPNASDPVQQQINHGAVQGLTKTFDMLRNGKMPEIAPTTIEATPERPGRDIPVIGSVLRGLDAFADNPITKKVGEIGKMVYTPGAGVANVAGLFGAAGAGISKIAPKLSTSLGGRVAQGAIQAGVTEAPIAMGNALSSQTQDIGEAAQMGLIGGGLGAVGGAAGPLIGRGLQGLRASRGAAEITAPSYEGISLTRNPKPAPESAAMMKGNWFTNLFGNQGVGISAFNSTKQLNKGPLTTEGQIVKSGLKNDAQGVKDTIAAQARASYQNMVDYLSPLKRIGQQVYESAMDSSRSNNIANTIIRDKFVNPEGQVMGEGLQNIFKKVARGQDKQFVDYLTLRHAQTRMGRGEQVYADTVTWNGQKMTPEVVRQRIDMYNQRHPGFQDIAKEWDGFHDNVLKTFGVEEGMISPELYTALREKNPNYSPMQRQFSRSEKPGRKFLSKTTNASFSGQKAPIKEVSPTGSARNIVDPRKTTIESVGAWANAAMRNRVMQSMVDAIKVNPEAFKGVAEIVQKPKGATDLRQVLLDGGQNDFVESLNGDFKNLFKTTKVDGENIVRAMVKGEPVYMQVHDPELVKTLVNMGPQASNVLVDVLTAFSNATKRGATGLLAPVFAVKGATMDLVQSAIQAKNPIQQAAYTVHAIFSGIGDKLNIPGLKNIAEEYRRSGGGYSAALKGERKLNTQISNMTRDPLLSPRSIGKGAVNLVKAPFKALESVGDIAENAPRIAAYKAELKRLGNERTPDNIRKAMDASREITVNFSRKGALSRDLEAAIPYNNAAIQGTYRIMKGIKENPVKTASSIAVLAVVPKLYEYAQFHADPDYQNLPARERMRFLFVHKNDDGTFTKIPMEPAYNSIGEMTIEAMRHFQDSDPQAFKGSMDALANAWLPPMVTGGLQGVTQGGGIETSIKGAINSTVAAPFVATVSNQSFTGAPIVSRSISDRSPQYQYDERTSSIAKKLGAATGMSPQKADYLIRAYGGDPARLLLPLTSEVGAGNTRNTLLKNFIVDPAYTNTLTNDYYAGKQKLDSAYRDNKEVGAPFPSWYDDGLRKQLDSQAAGSISKRLSILSDKKKTLSANKSLSAEQKAAQLKDIQAQTNSIYLDVNSRLQKSGVLGK